MWLQLTTPSVMIVKVCSDSEWTRFQLHSGASLPHRSLHSGVSTGWRNESPVSTALWIDTWRLTHCDHPVARAFTLQATGRYRCQLQAAIEQADMVGLVLVRLDRKVLLPSMAWPYKSLRTAFHGFGVSPAGGSRALIKVMAQVGSHTVPTQRLVGIAGSIPLWVETWKESSRTPPSSYLHLLHPFYCAIEHLGHRPSQGPALR